MEKILWAIGSGLRPRPVSQTRPTRLLAWWETRSMRDLREEFVPIAYYDSAQDAGAGAGAQILIRSQIASG